MAFGQLEDLEGGFELVIFSDVYEEHVGVLREARDEGSGEGSAGPYRSWSRARSKRAIRRRSWCGR